MSYNTNPISNRLGFNVGWTNSLINMNSNLTDTSSLIYIKSYLFLKEYLRFHQINLLSLDIKSNFLNKKIIHILIYKQLRYKRLKSKSFYSTKMLKRKGFSLAINKINNLNFFYLKSINTKNILIKTKYNTKKFNSGSYKQKIFKIMKVKQIFKSQNYFKIAKGKTFNIKNKVTSFNIFLLKFLYKTNILKQNIQFKNLFIKNANLKLSKIKLKNNNIKKNLNLIAITKNNNIQKIKNLNNYKIIHFFQKYLMQTFRLQAFIKLKNTSSTIKVKHFIKNYKNQYKMKQIFTQKFFKRMFFALFNTELLINPQLIAQLIANELAYTKKHKKLLYQINTLFDAIHTKYLLGYKILIDGKLNGAAKSSSQVVKFKGKDKLPVQEFNKRVLYSLAIARTYTGLFGVNVWFYY